MSKQYENELAKKIYHDTGPGVRVCRCGYSGNNAMPQPDVLVTDVGENHGLEIKGPIEKDTVYVEGEELEQLVEFQNGYTAVYLVVKFQYREPLVVRYFGKLTGKQLGVAEGYNDKSIEEKFAALIPPAFNARVTDGGNLALDKPSTDEWPSATAGSSDVDAVLSGLGIKTEDSVTVA